MKSVFALVPAAIVAGSLISAPAEAKCEDTRSCVSHRVEAKTKPAKSKSTKAKSVRAESVKARAAKAKGMKARTVRARTIKTARHRNAAKPPKLRRLAASWTATAPLAIERPGRSGGSGHVVEMIKSMSPSYGVPTWFALRIAKIESNYNPRVRGRAGEYGIYQMKCDTARGLGFSGGCGQLADARTNIRWGLKHLAEALKSSEGNLKLAASKHNAGLGRRTVVPHYVSLVF